MTCILSGERWGRAGFCKLFYRVTKFIQKSNSGNCHQTSGNIKITLRACLHEGGGPQVGEVTCGALPHLSCKRDHIKMRDYMDRSVTPPKRVTSPIWGTPPPCKQALKEGINNTAKTKGGKDGQT